MGKIADWFDRWTGRIANTAAIWPLVPAGALGVLSAYLASGVELINQFGWFGWLWAGLLAFAVSGGAFALIARTRLWRIRSRMLERLSSDSSPFDPMAPSFEGKRLFLKDLIPPGRRFLEGRKFTNCEIIGPGNIVVCLNAKDGTPPIFRGNIYYDVDCIQIERSVMSNNAIYFPGCDFDGCHFYNLNLLFYDRYETSWHWITPIADQPPMIPPPAPPPRED